MVRLLQRFWGSGNRGVDTARSPSQALAEGLRGLTSPARRGRARRSCRLQLEPLEDRLTPALLHFVPIADVAINPAPLAPLALVVFDPVVDLQSIPTTTQSSSSTVLVAGHFTQSGQSIDPTGASAPTSWSLDVSYVRSGVEYTSMTVPAPGQGGIFIGRDDGKVEQFATLTTSGPAGQSIWLINGTMTEQVTVSGVISPPDPATGISKFSSMFERTGISRQPLVENRGGSGWNSLIMVLSTGILTELAPPPSPTGVPPAALTATFMQQDSIMASFTPVIPAGPGIQPAFQVNAVFKCAGHDTLVPTPAVQLSNFSNSSFQSSVGSDEYQSQVSETITFPPTPTSGGSTIMLAQDFTSMGNWVDIEFELLL